MKTPFYRSLVIASLVACFSLTSNAAELALHRISPLHVEQAPGILSANPALGYPLVSGSKTVVVAFSKIENIDIVSFLNRGAKGDITIAISDTKLPANSAQWHVVAHQELSQDSVRANIGPTEAKYVRLTFNVTEAGRIADLGVYSSPAVSFGQVDGKDFDGKDKDFSKEMPEAPAEGPPPGLPQPPPFVFIPEIVPNSP